jgi:hypothetical protein
MLRMSPWKKLRSGCKPPAENGDRIAENATRMEIIDRWQGRDNELETLSWSLRIQAIGRVTCGVSLVRRPRR